ncbi:Spore coat protein SA [Polystyrenella longa]|uniref:Spore coat protein SA n=1 Tax=Polystyrenella longa TaxID=2528007 RepID=A0A518CQC1_9PLAN|nr:glycosyltransferase family 4 protein [Polystyrenella longa]QDU81413.1 Spore coat protein SA [Polystyrenella longa]
MARIGMTLANPNYTGACKMARLYGQAFLAAGHDVVLLHGPEITSENHDQTFIDALREDGFETELIPEMNKLIGPAVIKNTVEQARKYTLDCLIGFQQRDIPVALKASKELNLPALTSFQNQHTFHGRWPLPKLKESIFARLVRKELTLGICTSPAVQEEVVQRFKVLRKKTCVVYNGVEVLNFPEVSPEACQLVRDEFGIASDELMLINVGRIDPQKGLETLAQAVVQFKKSHPDQKFKLIQVGDVIAGPNQQNILKYREKLVDYVKSHGLADCFIMAGWRNDCPTLLKAADIYVHSAIWEGWSLAVVEAMGARLPSIQTDCCGVPEHYEQGKHGFIVPKGDASALSNAMAQMIEFSAEKRSEIGEAGFQFAAEYFEIQKTSQRFVQLVEENLKTSPASKIS